MAIGGLGHSGNNALFRVAVFKAFQSAIDGHLIGPDLQTVTNAGRHGDSQRLQEDDATGFFQRWRGNAVFPSWIQDALALARPGKDFFFRDVQRRIAGQDAQEPGRRGSVGLHQTQAVIVLLAAGGLEAPAKRFGGTRQGLTLPIHDPALKLTVAQQARQQARGLRVEVRIFHSHPVKINV